MKYGPLVVLCVSVGINAWAGLPSVTPSVQDSQSSRSWWLPRFDSKRQLAVKGGYDVVFLGDSITHNWESFGRDVWAANFADGPYRAINCGFSGDRTEHVLWRLDHGQLDGLKPKAVVLMIGTNNTGARATEDESPTDTALGVQAILLRLGKLCPGAKVILHPIFPRGAATNDPMRVRNDLVNSVLLTLADGKNVLWCDFNSSLLTANGTLERSMAADLLHPGKEGYAIWAEELKPFLDYALGKTAEPPVSTAKPAPTARQLKGIRTAIPRISAYWLKKPSPEKNRILTKRQEAAANEERYYDVIWLGDSITEFWEHEGRGGERGNADVFREKFAAYKILNLGFGGIGVQSLLWNIRYGGMLDRVMTRLVMLMIGTNNAWCNSAEEIAAGIEACLSVIHEKQPGAKVLLMPLLPREVAHRRGERDFRRKASNVDEIMPKHRKVNDLIRPLADGKDVIWCDLTAKFTDAEGLPDIALLGDGTHPNAAGYEVFADAVLPTYREILGK